jgi:two-component system, NtrC family, sensor histidine kinase HydH
LAVFACTSTCVGLAVLLIYAVWSSSRDQAALRESLLEAEIDRLRSHAERTVGRIERELESGGDLRASDGFGWLTAHWQAIDEQEKRLFAAVLDENGRVLKHSNPGRVGRRLARGWYERVAEELGEDVVETHSQVLTGGAPAYDVRVSIRQNGQEVGEYHAGFDIDWFNEWSAQRQRATWWRRSLLISGLLVTLAIAASGLYFVTSQGAAMRKAVTSSMLQSTTELGQLAAGLAHEIRNPLHAIQLNLHAFRKAQDRSDLISPDEIKAMLEQSSREIERIEQLVHQLLTFATPEKPRDELIDLSAEIRAVVEFIDQEMLRSNVTVSTQMPKQSITVRMDRGRLRQIMLNLLHNAQEALESGGKIDVQVRRQRGSAEIAVADDGPGVSDVERKRIFEPFYSTKEKGTGLGLALARRFVEEIDGEISCEPNDWGGTTFRIRLPESHARHVRYEQA